MGWRSQPAAGLVIVQASGGFTGLFIYDPKPGTGNLLVSEAGRSGTDPYGNPFLPGVVSYSPLGPYSALNGGNVIIGVLGAAGLASSLFANNTVHNGFLAIDSGKNALTDNSVTVALNSSPTTPGVVVSENNGGPLGTGALVEVQGVIAATEIETILGGVVETWHTVPSLSLPAGWTGTIRYRLTPDGEVELNSSGLTLSATATVANGTTIFTLPAAYQPAAQQPVNVVSNLNTGGGQYPHFNVTTAGAVQMFGMSVSTVIGVNARFPLN